MSAARCTFQFFGAGHERSRGRTRRSSRACAAPFHAAELYCITSRKIDLATGAMVGAEALIRWMHPEEGPG